jgi:hypothetical protein
MYYNPTFLGWFYLIKIFFCLILSFCKKVMIVLLSSLNKIATIDIRNVLSLFTITEITYIKI